MMPTSPKEVPCSYLVMTVPLSFSCVNFAGFASVIAISPWSTKKTKDGGSFMRQTGSNSLYSSKPSDMAICTFSLVFSRDSCEANRLNFRSAMIRSAMCCSVRRAGAILHIR